MIRIKLKDLVKMRGTTLTNVAAQTGISMNTLSVLGRGESKGIQFETLEKICRNLDATPNDLIELSPDEYTVLVSSQKMNDDKLFATAIKKQVIERSNEEKLMYNADEEEKPFVVTFQGTLTNGYGIMLAIGTPLILHDDSDSEWDNSVPEEYKWFFQLTNDQQDKICEEVTNIYLFNYHKGELPKHVLAMVYGDGSSSRVIDFLVDEYNKHVVVTPY